MKTLLKIYSASCILVVAFFVFFSIPWGILPFSDAVNAIIIGSLFVGLAAFYIFYFYKREGVEFGWFLANRGGFWAITVILIGLTIVLCGTLLYVSPELFVPAFEQGALPFGIAIASLFWLALIFMFAYLTVGMMAKTTANVREFQFIEALINALIGFVCLGLAGVFFSLFLEVINDIAIRISVSIQWKMIWIFVGLVALAGIVYGIIEKTSRLVERDESTDAIKE